ncbi:MAG: hypothetical protein WBF52_12490, partial [Geitlerinemataceae cyanobacterium]
YVASDTDTLQLQQNFYRDYQNAVAELDRNDRDQFPAKPDRLSAYRRRGTDLLELATLAARYTDFFRS